MLVLHEVRTTKFLQARSAWVLRLKMFRIGGPDKSPEKATLEAEKKKARQNVWFTLKVFTAYVAVLRLGQCLNIFVFVCLLERAGEIVRKARDSG